MKYILLISLIFFYACNPKISFNPMMKLTKGQSLKENLELIDSPGRSEPVTIQYNGQNYSMVVHQVLTSFEDYEDVDYTQKNTHNTLDPNVNQSTNYKTTHKVSKTYADYIFIFKEDKLITWGFKYELYRDTDLIEMIKKAYKEMDN